MRIVIVGFGSQAKAWALNLRDGEHDVLVALRSGSKNWEIAQKLGFPVYALTDLELKNEDAFVLLTPDHTHLEILNEMSQTIKPGAKIIYAHGYSYLKGQFKTHFKNYSHLLLAPKAIASEVRFQFETKGKLAAAFSLDGSLNPIEDEIFLKELSQSIGITYGPIPCSFQQETYADLFSEQGLLCSLLPYGALLTFNKLLSKGIPKDLAYMECWYELKLIADTLVKLGPLKFFDLISPNAMIGGEKAQKLLLNKEFSEGLDTLLSDIWSEKFFSEQESTDQIKLKEELLDFWKNEELTKAHENYGPHLFN